MKTIFLNCNKKTAEAVLLKKYFILFYSFLLLLASCKKTNLSSSTPLDNNNQSFKSIVATEQFKWTTTKTVTIDITPLETESLLSNTLFVQTLDGKQLLAHNMLMTEALQLSVDVYTETNQVKLVYGNIEKTLDIVNNRVAFDFVTPIPAEYE